MFLILLAWLAPAGAADLAAGQALYVANCTACHGAKGDGNGPAAVALTPKPANFTAATFWASKTDEQLIATIRGGRPGTSMTGFTTLSDADLANVVAWLRTLAPPG